MAKSTSGPRRTAAKRTSAGRKIGSGKLPKRPTKTPRRAAKTPRRASGRKPIPSAASHRFVASHLNESSFSEGLRAYAQYRDLGIAQATSGMVQAHVIRFVPPCRPEEVSKLHFHDVEFQMIYVLKGWIRSEFAGEGAHTFRAGACWIQPPRIEHKVLDYSDDCEVLEIILPADFETVTLD